MTPEIIARVDAWIADHRTAPLVRGSWLVNDWRKACTLWRYRRAKDPGDASGAVASAEAAMVGLLLALVREAWGRHVSSIRTDAGWTMRRMGASGWVVGLPVSDAKATEDESLVAALEAAPRREAGP